MESQVLPIHNRHRQRLRAKFERDEATMCDHEMLELFLFDAVPRHNTNTIAHALLDRFGSLLGVFAADKAELMKIPGVGEGVATYIKETYEEYCGRMHAALPNGEPVSLRQVRNFMIWHRMHETVRRGGDAYVTVIVLSHGNAVSDIYDTDDVASAIKNEKSCGTHAVIIGIGSGTEDADVLRDDCFVTDVICVNGTVAESLRREDLTKNK